MKLDNLSNRELKNLRNEITERLEVERNKKQTIAQNIAKAYRKEFDTLMQKAIPFKTTLFGDTLLASGKIYCQNMIHYPEYYIEECKVKVLVKPTNAIDRELRSELTTLLQDILFGFNPKDVPILKELIAKFEDRLIALKLKIDKDAANAGVEAEDVYDWL